MLARWGWSGGAFQRGSGGQKEVRLSTAGLAAEPHMPPSSADTRSGGPPANRITLLEPGGAPTFYWPF